MLAKVIDMFENGVDNVPANGNNNNDDTKDTVSGNTHVVSCKLKEEVEEEDKEEGSEEVK